MIWSVMAIMSIKKCSKLSNLTLETFIENNDQNVMSHWQPKPTMHSSVKLQKDLWRNWTKTITGHLFWIPEILTLFQC